MLHPLTFIKSAMCLQNNRFKACMHVYYIIYLCCWIVDIKMYWKSWQAELRKMNQGVKKSDGEEREQNTGMLIHPLDIFTTPSNHSQGGSSVGLYTSYITLDLCHVGLDPQSNMEESNIWLYNQCLL